MRSTVLHKHSPTGSDTVRCLLGTPAKCTCTIVFQFLLHHIILKPPIFLKPLTRSETAGHTLGCETFCFSNYLTIPGTKKRQFGVERSDRGPKLPKKETPPRRRGAPGGKTFAPPTGLLGEEASRLWRRIAAEGKRFRRKVV